MLKLNRCPEVLGDIWNLGQLPAGFSYGLGRLRIDMFKAEEIEPCSHRGKERQQIMHTH